MEYRNLGNSGLRVSKLGVGCNSFGGRMELAASKKVVDKAIDLGVNFFDTADIYGGGGKSEAVLGEALGSRRQHVVLATKFGMAMPDDRGESRGSRRYIINAVENSLRRLNTDWIDLYFMHAPDPSTPIEETLRALEDIVRSGKARYIGCSNFAAWQVTEAHWTAKALNTAGFIASQEEYNLVARGVEQQVIPALNAAGMGLVPYFPLAGGLLTGKYARNVAPAQGTKFANPGMKWLVDQFSTDANWSTVEALNKYCDSQRLELIDVAFAWLLDHGLVASVIAGASHPEQVERNLKAAETRLPPGARAEIDKLSARKPG
jgi:aryl-alcohol dehydrogenase-like predicted oxidoreductase